jgi:glucose-6-phosphate-specific signal transduction histidine kinase
MKTDKAISVLIFSVLLLVVTPLCEAQSAADDMGESAVLHVLAGAASTLLISAVAYPLVKTASDQRSALLVAGFGFSGALLAGTAKELLDSLGFGQPQWSDLLLTLGGGVLTATLVYTLTCLEPNDRGRSAGIAAVYGSFALIFSLPVGENLLRRVVPSLPPRS